VSSQPQEFPPTTTVPTRPLDLGAEAMRPPVPSYRRGSTTRVAVVLQWVRTSGDRAGVLAKLAVGVTVIMYAKMKRCRIGNKALALDLYMPIIE